MTRLAVIVGTRPEAIKLAPVILALRARGADCIVVNTGQHREMAVQALDAFGIAADETLETMRPGHTLGELTSRLFAELDRSLARLAPDWVVVQGDTSSAFAAAMTGFYRRLKVAHVEAGLRTYDRFSPFPEEVNRSFIGHLADVHFAPTRGARDNLLRAGVDDGAILVTGNTVVDAVHFVRARLAGPHAGVPCDLAEALEGRRLALVTSHRRESFGPGLENTCLALADLVARFPDLIVVYPVHLNPNVQEPVRRIIGREERIRLLPPLGYLELMALIERSTIVLTDSGGLQEEVPSFAKPILVLREVTERPEVLEVGAAKLVGTSRHRIVQEATTLLTDDAEWRRMAYAGNPFGDGRAGERIAARLLQ